MRKIWWAIPLGVLASCVSAPPPPAPAPTPVRPAPPPPVVTEDWRDIPLTPGSWAYAADASGSAALFGRPGAEADFIVRCDRVSRTVNLSRLGAPDAGASIGITTSAGSQSFTASQSSGTPLRFTAAVRASDPFLDKIAFSRGRFVVTSPGLPRLVLPAWAEVARTIEDCRK